MVYIPRNITTFTQALVAMTLMFSICNIKALRPTLENLNAMVLMPSATSADPKTALTIGTLFQRINTHKTPVSGILSIPNHANHPYWTFTKGLPTGHTDTLFIHAAPNDKPLQRIKEGRDGHSILCSNAWLKNSIIQAPWITFDPFYDRNGFDFGQGINITCLNFIYSQLQTKNPQASYVLASTCIGAKTALEFVTLHKPTNLRALILESPFADVEKVFKNWSQLTKVPAFLIKAFFKIYLSKFKKTSTPLLNRLSGISKDLPIFIAHLWDDTFYSNNDMYHLVQALRASGNQNIYLLVIKDKTRSHGHLAKDPQFAKATSAFLKEHYLPHDTNRASQGKLLLDQAKSNATLPPAQWQIAQ